MNRSITQVACILILGILIYSNTFHVPFIFDDESSIAKNVLIKKLDHFRIGSIGYSSYPTRFLGYLTFAINYKVGGLDVTGYHVVNLLIHIANALLVYLLVILTFSTPNMKDSPLAAHARPLAFVTALIFLVHPVQTQAVTYMVQRLTSLAAMLYLLSVVFYAKARIAAAPEPFRDGKSMVFLSSALLCSFLAMKTKEISFTLPIMITVYEFFFFRGGVLGRMRFVAPFLLLLPVIPLQMINIDKPFGEILSDVTEVTKLHTTVSRHDYLMTQFCVLVTYIRLVFFPFGQNIDHDYPIFHSFLEPRVAGSFLFLVGAIAAGIVLFLRSREPGRQSLRMIAFGIAWFFITISVESSVIPILDVINEHRLYLPMVGLSSSMVIATALLARDRFPSHWRSGTLISAGILILVFSGTTYKRNMAWGSAVSIWEDSARKSPGKARPVYNLGVALQSMNREEEAEKSFRKAIVIEPNDPKSYNNLGILLSKRGRHEEASELFRMSIELDPKQERPYNNLAVSLLKQGRHDEAATILSRLIVEKPFFAEAHYNLGRLYLTLGKYEDSIELLSRAIFLKPDYNDAYIALGSLYNRLGRYPESVEVLKNGTPLLGEYAETHYNLGLAYHEMGNTAEAYRELEALQRMSSELAWKLESHFHETRGRGK